MNADIDRAIGQNLRALRERRRLSQTALGLFLGVSFQQVQKYERGANRISCSTLLRAAQALDVPVMAFFEGMDTLDAEPPSLVRELTRDEGGAELARVYLALPVGDRALLVNLARTVAGGGA